MRFYTDIYLQGTASILNSSGTNILEGKQDILVSGVNIKTINGIDIVGSGNITVNSDVTSVAGRVGTVVLTKSDVGLDKVSNLLDSSRSVLSATKLTTARMINNIAFDGTSDITIPISGSYLDLTDKPIIPTIPTNVSYFTNDRGYITSTYHDSTKQDRLVSGTNIKTINGLSLLGDGDMTIGAGACGGISGIIANQTDLQTCFNSKQATLISGTNIKTINGNSLVGSGDLVVSGGGGGLVNFSESVCNVGTVYAGQNILTPVSLCTNADIILTPKGNGSIARVPASNTTVETARGKYSIDFGTHCAGSYGSMCCSHYSTSSGGCNTVNYGSTFSVISGGFYNCNWKSNSSVISGGVYNCNWKSTAGVIPGGSFNSTCCSPCSTISGGGYNLTFFSCGASIGGGCGNSICNSPMASSIGSLNIICTSSTSSIGGGACNDITASTCANIAGGAYNMLYCASFATIIGGVSNKVCCSNYTTILGGNCNVIAANVVVDRYTLLYGQCGQIGINDTSTLFALAYGTGVLTDNINNCNLVFCVTKTGITHTNGICALSGFKITGLPTTNPGVGTGLLWNNAGVLSIA